MGVKYTSLFPFVKHNSKFFPHFSPIRPLFRPDLQPDGNLAIEAVMGIRVQCCGIGRLPCQVVRDLILSSSRITHDSASCHGSPPRLDPFELGENVKRRSVSGQFELDHPVFTLEKAMSDPRLFELIFLNISPENIHWCTPRPCPRLHPRIRGKGIRSADRPRARLRKSFREPRPNSVPAGPENSVWI